MVRVQFPEKAREDCYSQILIALNAAPGATRKKTAVRSDGVELLRTVRMRILLIDEIHNVLADSPNEQQAAFNGIKYLMNELGRPVVAAGTVQAYSAIKTDSQMVSRMRPMLRCCFGASRRTRNSPCINVQMLEGLE